MQTIWLVVVGSLTIHVGTIFLRERRLEDCRWRLIFAALLVAIAIESPSEVIVVSDVDANKPDENVEFIEKHQDGPWGEWGLS